MSTREGGIIVRVPATSANVGVGYDCLGIALDMMATFRFAPSEDGKLHISGCEQRFRGADNLVWTSYHHACDAFRLPVELLRIDIDSPIPLAGGLGSSSACIIAGIVAARTLAGLPIDRKQTLQLACSLEGHPDNVAPAVLGGLTSSFMDRGRVWTQHFDVAESWRFVAIIPPYEVRTAIARQVMPKEVSLHTVVWQMGRVVATVEALKTGDVDLLAACAHDHLHEPYRARLIPDYGALRSAALLAGATAFFISGSGSTMLAVCDGDLCATRVARRVSAMESVAAAEGARRGLHIKTLRVCSHGASVELV